MLSVTRGKPQWALSPRPDVMALGSHWRVRCGQPCAMCVENVLESRQGPVTGMARVGRSPHPCTRASQELSENFGVIPWLEAVKAHHVGSHLVT